MDIHAAAYSRQSDKRANKSEVSTETQTAGCVEEAQRRKANQIELYEDLGISAFTGVERPDFERLLHDCRMGRINLLIVYYISRLSRMDPLDAIPIVTELLNLGVTIVSVTEGEFRRGNLMDLIHLILRLDAAHSESKNKSAAVLSAKKAARSLGGYTGGNPPYGFALAPETRYVTGADGRERPIVVQTLAAVPDEVAVVRAVWATIKEHRNTPYVHGRHPGSLTGICVQLTDGQTPTRGATKGKETKDSVWHPTTLRRILRDPRIAGYAADVVYKGPATISGYRIRRDPETMAPIVTHDPILPPEEWYELQEWLDGRSNGAGLSRGQALLTSLGIMYCACGRTFKAAQADKGYRASYKCARARNDTRLPGVADVLHDGSCAISMQALDSYVAWRIFNLIGTAEEDEETLPIMLAATKRFAQRLEAPETTGERQTLAMERADAVAALEELYDQLEAGAFRNEVGQRRFASAEVAANTRLAAADARIAAMDELSQPVLPLASWLPADPGASLMGEGSVAIQQGAAGSLAGWHDR